MFYSVWKLMFRCYRSYIKTFYPDNDAAFHVPPHKLPWLWIGAKYDNGDTFSLTSVVNDYVSWGDVVDTQYLDDCTELQPDRWIYLDPKTLEEKDFPSEGLLIEENDSKQQTVEKEDKC